MAKVLTALIPPQKEPSDIFPDWEEYSDNASRGDDIRNHPEIWDSMKLPEAIENMDVDTKFATFVFENRINLNACAIGLGLERIEYDPQKSPLMIYNIENFNATIIFSSVSIISITDSSNDPTKSIKTTLEQVNRLSLLDEQINKTDLENSIERKTASDLIEQEESSN